MQQFRTRLLGGLGRVKPWSRSALIWARAYDWRIRIIFLGLALSVFFTLMVYAIWGVPNPATHLGSVFASWVAGVAFFATVGLATAISSIAKPEMQSFDSRARILFQGQSGPHIDYIVDRMRKLFEHYSETTTRRIVINRIHEGENKYWISCETMTRVRSFIGDIRSTYSANVSCEKCTLPPEGLEGNKLVFLRVNEIPIESNMQFEAAFSRPFETTIEAGESAVLQSRLEMWVQADTESNRFRPVRYSKAFALEIENHTGREVRLKFIRGQGVDEVSLAPGQRKTVLELSDLTPENFVYDFAILSG